MNGITRKIILKISLFISLFIFVPSLSWGYNYSAVDIYRQAHFKNYRFLEWLSQYRGAVDMQNRLGDTAFCIALKYNDMETMKILASYRANTSHPCVRRARNEYYASRELYQPVQQTNQYPTQTYPTPVRETNAPYISAANGNSNYLWWGLGGLLVGGGIGAAIGHSSGSHKTTYVTNNNNGNGNNGGNTGGDDNGGNTGGDDNGGNTGGDDNGGNTGGDDNTGGNTGGDDNTGGNTGGDDNTGGNTGGDDNTGGNTGGDDNGGNTGGDDNGGNTGGDDNTGGNTGGDDNGGNTGGDDNGGNTGGDDNGGNTGGDDNGGNTGGDDNGGNTGGDDNTGGNTGGDDNTGGNTGGDDNTGGNTGGDDNTGGNTGGDDNTGGNTGGDDNTGGNTGGDDNTGGNDNTGGSDNPGGNTGGSDDGNSGNSGLTDVSASSFRTSEYTKGNFLDAIHAAEAYSIIYKQDANGNLVSHQAASDDPLKKVKVGVIDSGVFNNHADLSDKIVGNYDANQYNTKGNVWGYTRNHLHYYILYENGKYYFFSANTNNTPISVSPYSDMDLTTLNATLSDYGLTFSQFTLMNGAGGGNPGTDDAIFKSGTKNVATWWEIVTELSHGTHVAGIIAADKNDSSMHGIAFENAQIYAGSWDMEQSLYNMTKTMVDSGVGVINNSWGYNTSIADASNPNWLKTHDYTDFLSSYAYAAKNDAVWVQSTGNEGSTEAGVQNAIALLNLSSYGYNGAGNYEVPYVAVAALDTSTATSTAPLGRIADYSNWCGSAKDYCITAPGTNVNSTIAINNSYMAMDGTSMSAPVVSGSIALLMGYYPYLSGQNIAWLLLETANHSGAYADSSIYGRGVLDLEAALTTPAGSLSTATGNNFTNLKPVNDSKLYLNGSTQAKLAKALPEKIIAFDELHRPFEYKTENFVQTTHASNANFRNKVSHAALGGAKKTIKDEKTGFSFSQSEALDKGGKQNLSSIEIVHETDDGSATRFYYTENSKYMVTDVLTPTDNPYFAMNEAYGAENTWKLNDSSKFKLSLQTGENGLYERDYEQDRASFTERSYAINAEYSFNLTDYLELSTIGGILFEEDAMLGMNGQGGFAIKDGSTYYMGLKAALNLTPNLSLLAAYYRGYTKGQDTSMLALSDIETESYMLAGEYTLSPLHKVGLSLSSPLSVVRGKASFRYASGRDNYSDTIYMQKLTTSLKPAAKEYDLGLYYKGTPQSNLNLLGRVETRFNADGEKGLTDYLGIVGMQYTFPK